MGVEYRPYQLSTYFKDAVLKKQLRGSIQWNTDHLSNTQTTDHQLSSTYPDRAVI